MSDPEFVFMPNDPQNVITPCKNKVKMNKEIRFKVIQNSLNILKYQIAEMSHEEEDKIFHRLETCMLTYNPKLNSGNLNILNELCSFFSEEDCIQFCLKNITLGLIDMALALPQLFNQPIKLLKTDCSGLIELTKSQCACLLANAFFCTFPKREYSSSLGHFRNYPRINFNELYDDTSNTSNPNSWRGRAKSAKLEKLKCLINYFKKRIISKDIKDENSVLFMRKTLNLEDNVLNWENCDFLLLPIKAFSKGTIEIAENRLQVDFANKFVGGGTLGNGSAMEEIRFVTCPELIISQLFTECLADHEALVVEGFEQFSSFTGYGSTFRFDGDKEDDNFVKQIVALDALNYPRNNQRLQFSRENINRELFKCVAGFKANKLFSREYNTVASGKWGCGVYNGDPQLKSLIQWMATSVCNKSLELYTFGDVNLTSKITEVGHLADKQKCTVAFLYKKILKYGSQLNSKNNVEISLIDFAMNEMLKKYIQEPQLPYKVQSEAQQPSTMIIEKSGASPKTIICLDKTNKVIEAKNNTPAQDKFPERPSTPSFRFRIFQIFCMLSNNYWINWGKLTFFQILNWTLIKFKAFLPIRKERREISEESELDLSDC